MFSSPFLAPDDLEIMAYKKAWDVFLPADTPGEESVSSETKARWLRGALDEWGRIAQRLADAQDASPPRDLHPNPSRETALRQLLEALIHAEDVLLAFRKQDVLLDIPAEFIEGAYKLLDSADRLGLSTPEFSLRQIARRLSAAISHTVNEPQELTVRDGNLHFTATGRKVLDADSSRVVEGIKEVQTNSARSLAEIQESERAHEA